MKENKIVLAYFGHHKCATKTLLAIIQDACDQMGLRHEQFHSPKIWGYGTNNKSTLDDVVHQLHLDFVSYTNADMRFLGKKEGFRAIHLIRDPRDIAVSAYFSHYHSHSTEGWPELVAFREKLASLSKDDGMLENIKFTAQLPVDGLNLNLFDALMEWDYSLPNFLELKFETFIQNPYQTILDAFEFLGLLENSNRTDLDPTSMFRYILQKPLHRIGIEGKRALPAWALLYFGYKHSFSKLADRRNQGVEEVKSHYRKGIAGDWKNHFTDQHKKYFKENFNDLLIKMGYESNADW